MNNYEMPIWYPNRSDTRVGVICLDDGDLLISVTSENVSTTTRIPLETAELLAANILTAIRATQLKEAA